MAWRLTLAVSALAGASAERASRAHAAAATPPPLAWARAPRLPERPAGRAAAASPAMRRTATVSMQEVDFYATLGLGRGASDADIKKAYRSAARKWHPDVNQEDGAKEKFQEISEAYSVLSDPTMRQRYDQFGVAGVRSGSGGGPGPQDFDIGDIFEVCAQASEPQSVSPLRADSPGNRDSVAVFLRRTAGRWRAATLGAHAGR